VKERSEPERRCIVTRESGPKAGLIRFVAGPGDEVVPDLAERLPGRGMWVSADAAALGQAAAKGHFARAARRQLRAPADLAARVEALMAARPRVASFHFGLPEQRFVDALKAAGTVVLCSATTPAEARDLEARGVDAIIAQGWEAGGHQGFYLEARPAQIGTMALVPQVANAVRVPVIAAGGIADGRGIAAALALGAAGVQIGTAFLTCAESGVPAPHRAALLASDGSATRMTRAFSGRPARGVVNRFMETMEPHEAELPDFPLMNTVTGPLRKASAAAGSPDFIALWSGQAVGLNRESTAAELMERLVAETKAATGGPGDR